MVIWQDYCPPWSLDVEYDAGLLQQKGTKAPQAAGKIHTDFEKGFIMAEVMKFNDFKEEGSESAVKVRFDVGEVVAVLRSVFKHFFFTLFTGSWQIQATGQELRRRRWRYHLFQIQYTQCTKKETIRWRCNERINWQYSLFGPQRASLNAGFHTSLLNSRSAWWWDRSPSALLWAELMPNANYIPEQSYLILWTISSQWCHRSSFYFTILLTQEGNYDFLISLPFISW